jgi:hypothetical protein
MSALEREARDFRFLFSEDLPDRALLNLTRSRAQFGSLSPSSNWTG